MNFDIVGVDPSTNYLGLARFTINAETFDIVDVDTTTLILANIIPPYGYNRQEYVNTYLFNYLIGYFSTYPILYLSIESAFINKFRISSYGPLTRTIQTIRLAYNTVYYNIDRIIEYAPLYIKKRTGKDFYTDKDGTKNAVLSNNKINKFLSPNITEHEYDAIAIANVLYNDLKINKEMLYSI